MKRKSRKLQLEFEGFGRPNDSFGGALLKGNPKTRRPLDSKMPIHLTLRARGSFLRLPKTYGCVNRIIAEVAQKHGVRIYRQANVGNHLHLAIKIPHVRRWAAFIRELTGRIALAVKMLLGERALWLYRPHTRIVRGWRKAFHILCEYIGLNYAEAEGLISREQIRTLKGLRLIFDSA